MYKGLLVILIYSFSLSLYGQNTYQISMSVFSAAAENKTPKVINFSSMARYGEQEITPFTEDMIPQPQDPYGIAKLSAEKSETAELAAKAARAAEEAAKLAEPH